MTSPEAKPKTARGLKLIPALGAALLFVGVLYVIVDRHGKEVAGSKVCAAAKSTVQKLAPLAHGDLAALTFAARPAPFPDVSFQAPNGTALSTANFRGKNILLNLWATWCVPCRQELPTLDALQARLGGATFEVVAVDVDTARLDQRVSFLRRAKIKSLAAYADPTGEILQSLKESGPVIGLPTSFLIDAQGCRLGAMLGPANWSSADALQLISSLISSAVRRS